MEVEPPPGRPEGKGKETTSRPPAPPVETAETRQGYRTQVDKDKFVDVVPEEAYKAEEQQSRQTIRENVVDELIVELEKETSQALKSVPPENPRAQAIKDGIVRMAQDRLADLKAVRNETPRPEVTVKSTKTKGAPDRIEPDLLPDSSPRDLVRQIVEDHILSIETDAAVGQRGTTGKFQKEGSQAKTVRMLEERFGKNAVNKSMSEHPGISITPDGRLIEGTPLELMTRQAGRGKPRGEHVGRQRTRAAEKSKEDRDAWKAETGVQEIVDGETKFTRPDIVDTAVKEAETLARELKEAKDKPAAPKKTKVEVYQERLNGIFNTIRKYRKLKEGTGILPSHLKGKGSQFINRLINLAKDIAKDDGLTQAQRTNLLNQIQKSERDSLIPQGYKITDHPKYKTVRQQIEAGKRGEVALAAEAHQPTGRKFVEGKGGLKDEVARLDKEVAEGKITIDEKIDTLHRHADEVATDIAAARGLGDPKQLVRGTAGQFGATASRIGKWAFDRIKDMGKALARNKEALAEVARLKNSTVKQLKAELKSRGLKVSGRKSELIKRLLADKKLEPITRVGEIVRFVDEVKPVLDFIAKSIARAENVAWETPGTAINKYRNIARRILQKDKKAAFEAHPNFEKAVLESRKIAEGKLDPATFVESVRGDTKLSHAERATLERIAKSQADLAAVRSEATPSQALNASSAPKGETVRGNINRTTKEPQGTATVEVGSNKPKAKNTAELVEEGIVPESVTISKAFSQKLRGFVDGTLKKIGTSRDQIGAFYNSVADIFSQGNALLMSRALRADVTNRIVKTVSETFEKKGLNMTPKDAEALSKAVETWLSEFDNPFRAPEEWAPYSNRLVDLARMLHEVPKKLEVTGKLGEVLSEVNVLKVVEEAIRSLDKETQGQVMTQAFNSLMDHVQSEAATRTFGRVIEADLGLRLGIQYTDTPFNAGIKMLVARLLYQDAMPLGLPSRLFRPDQKTGKGNIVPVERPQIVTDALRSDRDAVIKAFNRELKARKQKPLTAKQTRDLFGDSETISADSKAGKMLAELDDYKTGQSHGLSKIELLIDAAKLKATEKKQKDLPDPTPSPMMADAPAPLRERGVVQVMQERVSDPVWDTFIHPDFLDNMGFEAKLRRDMASGLGQGIMMSKGMVTAASMLTNIGNMLGNAMAIVFTTGELPSGALVRSLKTAELYSQYRKNPKEFKKKNPELGEIFEGADRDTGIKMSDATSVEMAALLDESWVGQPWAKAVAPATGALVAGTVGWSVGSALLGAGIGALIGPKLYAKYLKQRSRWYKVEDVVPKLAEFSREFAELNNYIEQSKPGDKLTIQTSDHSYTVIRKNEDGSWSRGKGPRASRATTGLKKERGWEKLSPEELRRVKSSYAATMAEGRIFNYGKVPRAIKLARGGNKVLSVGSAFSPFMSFPYLAADAPGKKGLLSATLLQGALDNPIRSSNPWINTQINTNLFATAARRGSVAMAATNSVHDDNVALARLGRHSMEPGVISESIVGTDIDNPAYVNVFRLKNADGYYSTRLLWTTLASALNWAQDNPDKLLTDEELRVGAWRRGKGKESTSQWLRRKREQGDSLTPKDFLVLGAATGSYFTEGYFILKNGRTPWGAPVDNPMQEALLKIISPIAGTDTVNFARSLRGLASPKDAASSLRYPILMEETKRAGGVQPEPGDSASFANWSDKDKLTFYIDNFVRASLNVYARSKQIIDPKQENAIIRELLVGVQKGAQSEIENRIKSGELKGKKLREQEDYLKQLGIAADDYADNYKAYWYQTELAQRQAAYSLKRTGSEKSATRTKHLRLRGIKQESARGARREMEIIREKAARAARKGK